MTPPELLITIKRIGDAARHEYEATLSRADNNAEISVDTFTFNPDLLIDMEPQWMLDKAVPRHIDDTLRGDRTVAEYAQEQAQKLAEYGRRLYQFLFGDGADLQAFLKYNDAYAQRAHLTLALHSNAAILWRLPWEYIHDGRDFLALHGKFQLSRRPHELARLERAPALAGDRVRAGRCHRTEHREGDQRHPGSVGRRRTSGADPNGVSGRCYAGSHRPRVENV